MGSSEKIIMWICRIAGLFLRIHCGCGSYQLSASHPCGRSCRAGARMSFSFSLFLPSVFSFPCRRSKGARVPETPCLFGNQTAVFLKCAEIDCALESAKKPRTAGLCGRAAGACDCGPLSCYIFERGYHPTKHLQNRYQRSQER